MSDVQTLLNQKYEKLCMALGDLQYKKEAIDANIVSIKEQIRSLDVAVPELKKLEEMLKSANAAKEAE